MIKIRLVGEKRNVNLVRSADDQSWMNTPVGMAGRIGSGPPGTICRSCLHMDLGASKFSDKGKAAPCLERRRLANGKGEIQEVPVKSASCSQYAERADIAAALAFAEDHWGELISMKREKIEQYRQSTKRLEAEIRELQQMRAMGRLRAGASRHKLTLGGLSARASTARWAFRQSPTCKESNRVVQRRK